MRTTIDLTEDGGYASEGGCPDPSTICTDGDEVVLCFREVELRFQLGQFFDFLEAANRWAWLGRDDEVDVHDREYIPAADHERLRRALRKVLDGLPVGLRGVTIPEDFRDAIRSELALVHHATTPENWRFLSHELEDAEQQIRDLKAQLGKREKRKAARAAKEPG